MRSDLTANFLAQMVKTENSPIQLAVFHFDFGDVYLSDRDLVLNGVSYDGLIENWGELATVGAENAISSTMTSTLSIWNGGKEPFSDYFLIEDPVNVFVDLYQTYEGLDDSDKAHIGEFVVQDPIEINEVDFLLNLDLVTTNMRYFAQVGELVTKEKYPQALEADINKPIDLIIGDAGYVKCLCSYKPPTVTVSGSFLANPCFVYTHEDPREEGFPHPSGFVQVDSEIMFYGWIGKNETGFFFNVTARGTYGTVAAPHSDGSLVTRAAVNTKYIVGQGPITSISDIRVHGQIPKQEYRVYPNWNPAQIHFLSPPSYVEYSRAVSNILEYPDNYINSPNNPATHNTAKWPSWSYDRDEQSKGALISRDYRKLSVVQETPAEDQGEIVKVFLDIEHWCTKAYFASNDIAVVWVDGQQVGYLNKPNEKDIIEMGGEVNIAHHQDHASSEEPTAETTDTDYSYSSPAHDHNTLSYVNYKAFGDVLFRWFPTSGTTTDLTFQAFIDIDNLKFNASKSTVTATINVNNFIDDGDLGTLTSLRLTCVLGSKKVHRYAFKDTSIKTDEYEYTIDLDFGSWEVGVQESPTMRVYAVGTKQYQGKVAIRIGNVKIDYDRRVYSTADTSVSVSDSVVKSTQTTVSGTDTNNVSTNKDTSDVSDLEETDSDAQKELELSLENNASRAIVQRFDLTQYLTNISWEWLKDRIIIVAYNGSESDVEIIITDVALEIEYRQRSIKFTDEITCKAVGSINNRPDAVIQYLLHNKAGVPLSKMGSVQRNIPKWNDEYIWNDSEIWQDEGQIVDVPGDAYFEVAASWFAYKRLNNGTESYTIDGVISGDSTVKDAVAKVCLQSRSRLTWQNGEVKLSILRKNEDWLIAKNVEINDIQLKSYQIKKSEINSIVNKIDLFHQIDRLSSASGSGKYDATAYIKDSKSISKHGERVDNERFLFDLIRKQSLAEDLASYYVWAFGETSTYYKFNAYLKHFDLEKEDYVTINSSKISKIKELPTTIKELVRVFGSGKENQINLLQLICQSIRHYHHKIDIGVEGEEKVIVSDALSIILGFDLDLNESVTVTDEIFINWIKDFTDNVFVLDSLETLFHYKPDIIEPVIVSDDLTFHTSFEIHDTVSVNDSLNVNLELCYGACGYGELPYGARTVYKVNPFDSLSVKDILVLVMNFGETIEDTVSIDDNLITSTGYGCLNALDDGYGVTPYGC